MVAQPTIGDVFAVVYRRKWSIAFVALIVSAIGAFYLMNAIPRYKSDASIVVRFGRSAGPSTDLARDQTPYVIDGAERRELISAHLQILTSADLAEAVINRVGLTRLYPAIANTQPIVGTRMDASIERFTADLGVTAEPTSNVIRLAFSSPDPEVAKQTVQGVIDEYVRRESEIFSDTNLAFQKQQADVTLKRLVAAQNDLATFKTASHVTDFDSQMNALLKQQSELRTRLDIAQVTMTEASQKRDSLTRLIQGVPAASADTLADKYRQVDDAQGRMNDLQAREREMTAMHGSDWPAARELRASIAEAQSTVAASASTMGARRLTRQSELYQNVQTDLLRVTAEAQSAQLAVKLVSDQVAEIATQISALETARPGLQQRQRELEIADTTYRSLALRAEDSRIGADQLRDGITSVAVIVQPNLPFAASSPRYKLLALVTAASAILAGLMVGVARELLDDRFISARQVTSRLNVPVLAAFDKR